MIIIWHKVVRHNKSHIYGLHILYNYFVNEVSASLQYVPKPYDGGDYDPHYNVRRPIIIDIIIIQMSGHAESPKFYLSLPINKPMFLEWLPTPDLRR